VTAKRESFMMATKVRNAYEARLTKENLCNRKYRFTNKVGYPGFIGPADPGQWRTASARVPSNHNSAGGNR
jgi:hypothetical protein